MFKKKPTTGLPEVPKVIDSVISKIEGDPRKHRFI